MKYFILILIVLSTFASFGQKVWKFDEFKKEFIVSEDTIYVVNFWATWCGPCIKELPAFEANYQHFKNKPVKFYFLSLDFGSDAWQKANGYLDKKGYSFDSYLTTDEKANEWIPRVDKSWSGSIPATVIYKGSKKYFHEGMLDEKELKKQIQLMFN
jgi:thiol-disulfide isomerase/thioredoxin